MPRTSTKTMQPVTDVVLSEAAVTSIVQAQDTLAMQEMQANDNARAVAQQVGYDGLLTVGALEDGIRFYQRRTVEALAETGKRLLVLRELSQSGTEFDQRVEMLGFARSSAYRFMQAASKMAKSQSLAALSTQVKSASAFLELVTHDDDTLAKVQEMDDIDRMSASELRAAVRQAKEDNKFLAEKRDKEMQRADKLEKALKTGPKQVPLSERLADFLKSVDDAHNAASEALLQLQSQLQELDRWWMEEAVQMPGYDPERATPLPIEVQAVAQKLYDGLERLTSSAVGMTEQVWDSYGHELKGSQVYQQAA